MLDVCSVTCRSLSLHFICSKSFCIKFGPLSKYDTSDMFLCGNKISWIDSIKYLGIIFISDKQLSTDDGVIKRKSYAACNCLFVNCINQQELLQLPLLESYCLPILTYCTVAVKLSNVETANLNACWNSVFRQIFGFHKCESVRCFVNGLGKHDFIHIRMKLMLKLYNSLVKRQDSVGSICIKLFQMDNHFVHMCNQLGIDIHSTLLVDKALYASLSELHKHFNDTCRQ